MIADRLDLISADETVIGDDRNGPTSDEGSFRSDTEVAASTLYTSSSIELVL